VRPRALLRKALSFINFAAREINCKIVYYGAGLGGKTTNLQVIYQKTAEQQKGKMISLATETERTLFFDFLPALTREWRELRLRIGRRFIEEWNITRHWSLDDPSPFEAVRVLDPAPDYAILDEGKSNLALAFPVFKDVPIVERWAGLIDVTPDAVPVISPVEALPGFYLASGFSGHGFGIGPAAGRLVADLVTGASPIVDPTPFRFERFARGRRSRA